MPFISVILVTFNREHYLPTMLSSLRNQTFKDYELILVNNGSTDNTMKICNNYANNDTRVKLIHNQKNIGASFGRNSGLSQATGDFISFVDDDDRCGPSMLEVLADIAIKTNADISMCGSYNEFSDRLEPYFIFDEKYEFDRLQGLKELLNRKLYNVAPPTKLFRRSLWNGFTFPENVLVDDIHVVYKVFEKAQRVSVWGIPLYFFRKHSSNMTSFIHNRTMTPELLNEYLNMYQTRAAYLIERAPEITKDVELSMIAFMESMCSNIKQNNIHDCDKYLTFMTEYLSGRK